MWRLVDANDFMFNFYFFRREIHGCKELQARYERWGDSSDGLCGGSGGEDHGRMVAGQM